MSEIGTLAKSIVADYYNYCNRHQEKTMPEAVFLFLKLITILSEEGAL